MHNSPGSPRFSLVRRFLLPYSGEVPLTRAQALRVVRRWAIFFALVLSLGTLPVALALGHGNSLQRLALVFLLTFFGSAILFGLMASLVVFTINRTAYYKQQWKERSIASKSSISGGRYGS